MGLASTKDPFDIFGFNVSLCSIHEGISLRSSDLEKKELAVRWKREVSGQPPYAVSLGSDRTFEPKTCSTWQCLAHDQA